MVVVSSTAGTAATQLTFHDHHRYSGRPLSSRSITESHTEILTSSRRTSECSCAGWRLRSWLPAARQKRRAVRSDSAAAGGANVIITYQCIIWVHGRHGCCCFCGKLVQLACCYAPVDAHGHLLGNQHLQWDIIESMNGPDCLLTASVLQVSTYRVAELCVEAIAELVDPGCDLVKLDRLFPAISFYDIHGY